MWLYVWLACSIAASTQSSTRADPAPAPAPLIHQPRSEETIGAGESAGTPALAGASAGALPAPAGASSAVSSYGWHENVRGDARDGQFYVQIQDDGGAGSQHRVQYTADADGYHPLVQFRAVGAQHEVTSSFALGERAVQLLHATRQSNAQEVLTQPTPTPTLINDASTPGISPVPEVRTPDARDYYLVPQQFLTSPGYLNAQFQDIPLFSTQESNSNALAVTNMEPVPIQYFIQHPTQQQQGRTDAHSVEKQQEKELQVSSPLDTDSRSQVKGDQLTTPLIQVFTKNCTESAQQDTSYEAPSSERQSSRLYADVPNYKEKNLYYNYDQSFGSKVSSGSEKGNKESKRDSINYRTERVYYPSTQPKSVFTTVPPQNNVTDGISKLVASTQNLISNDDLLDINNAAEDDSPVSSDDIIKPQPKHTITKLYPRTTVTDSDRSEITVSAKIGRLVDSASNQKERLYVDDSKRWTSNNQDQYRFATPIVVQGSTVTDVKSQIVENLMSTVVPYLEQGYELTAVRNDLNEQSPKEQKPTNDEDESEENYEGPIDVTPRPVSQKFLAPLTVGLTLIYSNNTDVLDNVLDHDVSDSEIVSDAVQPEEQKESVRQGKTIVEVQPSIPIEFTEINDIVIRYDDSRDGKRNEELKMLQNQFSTALESSKKIQKNINENLYRFGAQQVLIHPDQYRNKLEAEEKAQEDQENRNFEENSEPIDAQSETDVHEQLESQQNERKEYISAYNNNFGEKIIQPIIIEKEVPVTKFVDRFIEKKVPYPQPVEVVKEVPVEKPVPYPVTVEKYINRPVEVTRYVDRPREVLVPQPYEVKVPYVFENKIYIDRPIPIPVDRVVEKQVPVPTPVGVPVSVEKAVFYPIEVGKPYPVPYAVDRPVPVDRVVEKQVPVPYLIEKKIPVPVGIPIDTRVPVPYPVDRIVERRIPYPVDRIVEKIVEKKVEVPVHVKIPYPVEKLVEKVVTKYVNRPYPVETRVPYPVPYEKVVEKKVPYPVEIRVPYDIRIPHQVAKQPENVSYNSDKAASYAVPGPPYQYPPISNAQYGQSAPQNYVAAKNPDTGYVRPINVYSNQKPLLINTYNLQNYNAFIPAPPSQSVDLNDSNVKSIHWGNLYSSSYQYIKPNTTTYQKPSNLDKYMSYLTDNSQYAGNRPQPHKANQVYTSNHPWGQPKVMEWKLRRTDRTLKVSPLNIEYGGFKPPLVPSTEVDLDGLPVNSDDKQ